MKRVTNILIYLAVSILLIVHLPNTYAITLADAIINVPVLNVRDGPGTSYKIMTKVYQNEHYQIIDRKKDWVKIQINAEQTGWVAAWFITEQETIPSKNHELKEKIGVITADVLNVRNQNSLNGEIIGQVVEGDLVKVIREENNWYKVILPNQLEGWVAAWYVELMDETTKINYQKVEKYLKGKTIVLDAGHGGQDSGTIGVNGILEKDITLQITKQVAKKLQKQGANVILTRNDDEYVSLQDRVFISNSYYADAFISIHCDSINQSNIRGTATYYYHSKHKQLAKTIQSELVKQTRFPNRNTRFGDYKVIRENNQPAILIELGFLSNPSDVFSLLTKNYQNKARDAIYYGLAEYFKKNSESS